MAAGGTLLLRFVELGRGPCGPSTMHLFFEPQATTPRIPHDASTFHTLCTNVELFGRKRRIIRPKAINFTRSSQNFQRRRNEAQAREGIPVCTSIRYRLPNS